MDSTIDIDDRDHPGLRAKVEHANELLETTLGNEGAFARARWELDSEDGPAERRSFVQLILKDGITGDVGIARFTLKDFESDSYLRFMFRDLWFDLLSGRFRRHMEAFDSLAEGSEGNRN